MRGMYGTRGRVGLIPPANLETMGVELQELLPRDVALVVSALRINVLDRAEIDAETAGIERAAAELATLGVDLIALSGGPVVYLEGPGAERAVAERVERVAGVPAFHDVSASVELLRSLGARSIAFASPFTDEVNAAGAHTFEAAGFEVRSIVGLGINDNVTIRRQPTEVPYRTGREAVARAGGADALFISCGGWCSLPSVAPLEAELGIPVVTQTQALVWKALAMLGIPRPGAAARGRSFREVAASPGR